MNSSCRLRVLFALAVLMVATVAFRAFPMHSKLSLTAIFNAKTPLVTKAGKRVEAEPGSSLMAVSSDNCIIIVAIYL